MSNIEDDKFKDLGESEKLNKLFSQMSELNKRMEKLEEEVLNEVEITKKRDDRPILEKYPGKCKSEFMREIKEKSEKREGITWKDIRRIFPIQSRSRCYDIFGALEGDYNYFAELNQSPRNILVHKKYYILGLFKEWYPNAVDDKDMNGILWKELLEELERNAKKSKDQKKIDRVKEIKKSFNY